ncbi:MAG: hypothetical protein HQK77_07800 [Desulfobacterales bacterium]|nr:hypothetical protein [Desulfobacterales bacterium]
MISSNFILKDFITTVQNMDRFSIIEMANDEATEAERFFLRMKQNDDTSTRSASQEYANALKSLIFFMRYAMSAPFIADVYLDDFRSLQMESSSSAVR